MNLSSFSTQQFKQVNALLKKRDSLLAEIKTVDKQLKEFSKIQLKAIKKKSPLSSRRKKTFKNLRTQILEILAKSGKKGKKVADIAKTLKLSTNNIYSWFYTTGAKNRKIKKVAPGTYGLVK
ncbi:MAG: hypothetical protein V4507_10995 [Verrucomicrobiota bacterium]